MAKPDLQSVYVKADDGVVRRDKGKLGLAAQFDNAVQTTSDALAAAAGVPVGGVYIDTGNSNALRVRLT